MRRENDIFDNEARAEVNIVTENYEIDLQEWKFKSLISMINNLHIRSSYQLVKSYAEFVKYKGKVLSVLPKPRRKLQWEKMIDHEYELFYEDAMKIVDHVPEKYKPIYQLIIKRRQIPQLLFVQRFVKKRHL